jgi:GH15 family glucan-1,4-alpha-glucosidase
MKQRSIGDYALIGDCETSALVSSDGSIDWLCVPRFDSPACFTRLLGTEEHGFWRIGPAGGVVRRSRSYVADTLVLETRFVAESGEAVLTDFMPFREEEANLVRIVRGVRGTMEMECALDIRFGYGRVKPLIEDSPGGFCAIAGPDGVVLRSDVRLSHADGRRTARFSLSEGQTVSFSLTHFKSHHVPPPAFEPVAALKTTVEAWRAWSRQRRYEGPYDEAVARSLIILKALTYGPTGGIVAAPTTSLPEHMGGDRNWDYRYCWLRDATFTLLSLLQAGYRDEAAAWRQWLVRSVAENVELLQPLFGVAGEAHLIEWAAEWLPGFAGSGPVRIGNAAHTQFQLDVYGEVLDALFHARAYGVGPVDAGWRVQHKLADFITEVWTRPDAGIWEVRSQPRHFTHSKVMSWVGLDRCIRAAEEHQLEGDVDKWRAAADQIHVEIMRRGFNEKLGAFTREFDSDVLDASALLLPELGFIDASDPRMAGTVKAIERNLRRGPYVRRYDTSKAEDGLTCDEGVFLPCSCWLADIYVLQGRRAEAEELFGAVLDARNDVGLLAEEFDPDTGELLGNFPQALSHISVVDTAFNLATKAGPARVRGRTSPERRREEKEEEQQRG